MFGGGLFEKAWSKATSVAKKAAAKVIEGVDWLFDKSAPVVNQAKQDALKTAAWMGDRLSDGGEKGLLLATDLSKRTIDLVEDVGMATSDLALAAYQAGMAGYRDVEAGALKVACEVEEVVESGWNNARELHKKSEEKSNIKISNKASVEVKNDGKFDKTEGKIKIGVKVKNTVYDDSLLFYGDPKDSNLKIGHAQFDASTGYNYDPVKEAHNLDVVKLNAKVSVVEGNLKGDILKGAFEGKVHGEILSASANTQLGLTLGKTFADTKATAGAGVEAVLVQGDIQGQVNITPKVIYDNTVGNFVGLVNPGSNWETAADYFDHGIVLGGKGEAGIGAAAKIKGTIGKDEETGAWGLTGQAKVGAGPMAGLAVFIGVK